MKTLSIVNMWPYQWFEKMKIVNTIAHNSAIDLKSLR